MAVGHEGWIVESEKDLVFVKVVIEGQVGNTVGNDGD